MILLFMALFLLKSKGSLKRKEPVVITSGSFDQVYPQGRETFLLLLFVFHYIVVQEHILGIGEFFRRFLEYIGEQRG